MKRKPISRSTYNKIVDKTAKTTKTINLKPNVMRGGIRL